jgi:hypothetical protein
MLAATQGHAEGVHPEHAAAGMKILTEAGITFISRTQTEITNMLGPGGPHPKA